MAEREPGWHGEDGEGAPPQSPTQAGSLEGPDEPDGALGPGAVVACAGACGGLGTTTLTVLLARALTDQGWRVALVDADPAGGLGLFLGQDHGTGLCWADLPPDEVQFRPERLANALPEWLGATVLTGDWRGGAPTFETVLAAVNALAATHDVVLVDLPRTATPPQGWRTVLLCGLDLRSAAAARVLAARMSRASGEPVHLVVRRRGEDLDPASLERGVGASIVGWLPADRSLEQRLARGGDVTRGRGAARASVRRLAVDLGELLGTGRTRRRQHRGGGH